MARINLLPWRVERRQQRQREFYIMLSLAAAAGVLLSLLVWAYYNAQIGGQNERNAFLRGEIAKVETQITEIERLDRQKDRLLARKKVIEELQANRSQMVHLFDSLVRTMPDGVTLTSLKQAGDILTLEGRSQSNARVSTYMRNLESSGWMTQPELSIIEAKAPETGAGSAPRAASRELPYAFVLQVKLANPGTTADESGVGIETEDAAADTVVPDDAAAPAEADAAPADAGTPAPAEPEAETPPPAADSQTPAQDPQPEQARS